MAQTQGEVLWILGDGDDQRIFLGRKIWLSGDFFGIQNNLKIRGRVVQRIKCNQTWARKFGIGLFWGLIFDSGIIFWSCWKP